MSPTRWGFVTSSMVCDADLAAKAPASRREAPRHLRLRGHRICDLAVRIVGRARRRKPEPADTALARPSIRTQPRRKETDRSDTPHQASWAGSGMATMKWLARQE